MRAAVEGGMRNRIRLGVHLRQDQLAFMKRGGKVIEILDCLEGHQIIAGRTDLAKGAQDTRVGAQRKLADALVDPRTAYSHDEFVLVDAGKSCSRDNSPSSDTTAH